MNRPPNLTIWWSVFYDFLLQYQRYKKQVGLSLFIIPQELTSSCTFAIFESTDVEIDFFIITLHLYL